MGCPGGFGASDWDSVIVWESLLRSDWRVVILRERDGFALGNSDCMNVISDLRFVRKLKESSS